MAAGNGTVQIGQSPAKLTPLVFEHYEDLKNGNNPKKKREYPIFKSSSEDGRKGA